MVSSTQRDIVLTQLEQALKDGAVLRCGGETNDNYISPTVLTGCVAQFANVCAMKHLGQYVASNVFPVTIKRSQVANDTPYGLGGAVYGESELCYERSIGNYRQ